MAAQNQGIGEAVARYRAELSAAVTRSRRAAAEARAQSATFRAESKELADGPRPAEPTAPNPDDQPGGDDEDFSDHSSLFRR
jgi:hypothetical protein